MVNFPPHLFNVCTLSWETKTLKITNSTTKEHPVRNKKVNHAHLSILFSFIRSLISVRYVFYLDAHVLSFSFCTH